jgi:hypothetical protein
VSRVKKGGFLGLFNNPAANDPNCDSVWKRNVTNRKYCSQVKNSMSAYNKVNNF